MAAKTLASLALAVMLLAGCANQGANQGANEGANQQAAINAALAKNQACVDEVNNRPDYAALRAHSYSGPIPASALADNRRPTPEEARLVVARWDAMAPCREALQTALSSANRADQAQVLSGAFAQTTSVVARFGKGDMTWGQYAQAGQAIQTAMQAQMSGTGANSSGSR